MTCFSTIHPVAGTSRLTISMKEFCQLSGIGKSKAWLLVRDGKLAVTRVGRRTLISYESAIALIAPNLLETYLHSLPSALPVSIAASPPAASNGQVSSSKGEAR